MRFASSGPAVGSIVQLTLPPTTDASGRWVVRTQRAEDKLPGERDGAGLEGLVSTVLSATRFTVDGVTVDSSAAQVDGLVQPGARVQAGPPDQVRGFELNGSPSALNTVARRCVLRGVTVDHSNARFKDGSAASLLGDTGLHDIKGRLSADRQVLEASSVEFEN